MAALSTPDGLWSVTGVGGTARGTEAIKAHSRILGKDILWGQHNMFAPILSVADDGESATGTFYLICLLTMRADNPEGREAYILAGKYKDKFVKVNGKWLFSELMGPSDLSAPWSDGWVKNPFTRESW